MNQKIITCTKEGKKGYWQWAKITDFTFHGSDWSKSIWDLHYNKNKQLCDSCNLKLSSIFSRRGTSKNFIDIIWFLCQVFLKSSTNSQFNKTENLDIIFQIRHVSAVSLYCTCALSLYIILQNQKPIAALSANKCTNKRQKNCYAYEIKKSWVPEMPNFVQKVLKAIWQYIISYINQLQVIYWNDT